MIDAKELRIGNLIKCIVHLPIGYYQPSLLFSEIMEIRAGSVETNVSTHKYREIGPIKLTEDILLSSGGRKVSENEILFNEGDAGQLLVYKNTDSGKFYLGINGECKTTISIDAVHNFQNIYYDLLGKDVKIIFPKNYEIERV